MSSVCWFRLHTGPSLNLDLVQAHTHTRQGSTLEPAVWKRAWCVQMQIGSSCTCRRDVLCKPERINAGDMTGRSLCFKIKVRRSASAESFISYSEVLNLLGWKKTLNLTFVFGKKTNHLPLRHILHAQAAPDGGQRSVSCSRTLCQLLFWFQLESFTCTFQSLSLIHRDFSFLGGFISSELLHVRIMSFPPWNTRM